MKNFLDVYSPLHRKYRILKDKYKGQKRLLDEVEVAERKEIYDTIKKRMKLYARERNRIIYQEPWREINIRS